MFDIQPTVAGGVFLSSDKSLRVEKTPVWAVPDFINNVRLEVDVQGPGHVLARRRFREESAEATVVGRGGSFHQTAIGLNRCHSENYRTAIWCKTHAETVLDGVQFPYDNQVSGGTTL